MSIEEPKGFERARVDVGEPVMGDTVASVELSLHDPIPGRSARRKYLADPVGCDLDRTLIAWIGQSLSPPPSEVWPHDVVRAATNVYFDEDPSATRSTVTVIVIERTADEATERPLDLRVLRQRRRGSDHLARDHLRAHVVRDPQEILVRSEPANGQRHAPIVARARVAGAKN